MYHSVPVDKNRRFLVIYINGMAIYLATTLVSLLVGVISAAAQNAVNCEAAAVIGLGFLWNFLVFLVIYHTVILAVMLTGNRFITLFAAGTFALYEMLLYILFNDMQHTFFDTKDAFYIDHKPKLSVVADYINHIQEMKNLVSVRETAVKALPFYGKWLLLAAALLAAAWLCYRKRPSEAAGRAMAFPAIKSAVKVIVVIPAAIGLGMWVHNAGYGNTALTVTTMVAAGVVASAVMEVIYDFDLKSLFRHLISSGAAVIGIVVIFFIFKADIFGYDKYIPLESKLESAALVLDFYPDFWDEEFKYVGVAERIEENMHIVDTGPVLELASRAQQEKMEDMEDPRMVHVLYRLKSGRKVGRKFYVDLGNPANEEPLNRIVGTQEYRDATYQVMTDQKSFGTVQMMSYSNGATEVVLPPEDGLRLREAYVKDMQRFDFTLARSSRPCGEIRIHFPNWMSYTLSVYDSFENTIEYLKAQDAYYPVQLNPEDIDCITVTNYHNELQELEGDYVESAMRAYDVRESAVYVYEESNLVSETFYEQEEFAKIVPVIYPNDLSAPWHGYKETDCNYDVYITFKKDTTYPYNRSNYGFNYQFYAGQVPEFVAEATKLGAD